MVHEIRLREPWKWVDRPNVHFETQATANAAECRWYVRRFNRPTGLGPRDQILLSIVTSPDEKKEGPIGPLTLSLNDQPIELAFNQQSNSWTADLSQHLQPFNSLCLGLNGATQNQEISQLLDIRLQILQAD